MKSLFVFILLFTTFAYADLLDRVHLEDALRTRLEQIAQMKDPKARVLAHLQFRKFETELPGTNGATDEYTPTRLELTDISKLEIDVYTELTSLSEETKTALVRATQLPNGRVSIHEHHVEAAQIESHRSVEAKDLAEIAQKSVDALTLQSRFLLIGFAAVSFLFIVIMWIYGSRRMNELKSQFTLLANAISEGGGGRSAPAPLASQQQHQSSSGHNGERALSDLPRAAINELFADSYWCENDGYAHWLWKNLDSQQRTSALADLPFLAEYSLSFVSTHANEQFHHEHPFYMNAVSCAHLSMKEVNTVLAKDLTVWNRMSPMRQAHATLSLQNKLKAVATRPSGTFAWPSVKSELRKLSSQVSFSDISTEDELALFAQPNLAPVQMRQNIRSLVWLAHRDDATIRAVLTRYDARSLASAWVGAAPILTKLESYLPEKKLKLLRMYSERETPSRTSSVYDSLVQEGLKDEAA